METIKVQCKKCGNLVNLINQKDGEAYYKPHECSCNRCYNARQAQYQKDRYASDSDYKADRDRCNIERQRERYADATDTFSEDRSRIMADYWAKHHPERIEGVPGLDEREWIPLQMAALMLTAGKPTKDTMPMIRTLIRKGVIECQDDVSITNRRQRKRVRLSQINRMMGRK